MTKLFQILRVLAYRWAGRCVSFVLLLCTTPVWAASDAVWLAGEDPVVQQQKHKQVPADYMDLFKPDAPWPTSASQLKVFKISTQMALHGTTEQLHTIINDLRRRHIALAVEMGLIVGSDSCGKGVEGYGNPNSVENTARHIKSLGGTIDYVAMDEPVWFGHIFGTGNGGRVGCRYPLPVLAEQIASKIAILRQYFPKIQVGDIEPVNAKWGGQQSIDDIVAFENLLRQRTGTAPAFVHTDMAWAITGWQPLLENLATRLHASGMRVGVICDGDANVGGDEAWVRQALQRCQTTLADPRVRPDDLIVQSWEPLPTKMLPETDPGSLTYEAVQVQKMAH
jgi:hypothetical protein